MQPLLNTTSTALGAGDGGLRSVVGTAGRSRRSTAINYAEPPSGDEGLDAGAIDSEDSDFVASGGVRTSIRRAGRPSGGTPYGRGTPQPGGGELDQSYLGMIPPSRFITAKPILPTAHEYLYVSTIPLILVSHSQYRISPQSSSDDKLEVQASKPAGLIPIRVEFETETHRIRDCFVWNSTEVLITPEKFASVFCADLDLPQRPWVETVANQMRAQIEEHEAVATMDLSPIVDYSMAPALNASSADMGGVTIPDCRVILSVRVYPPFVPIVLALISSSP
jgi:chromatin structure-remodeling complex subunit SFH1